MSYILDALRKADADRARDPARGIHAQAVGSMPETPRRIWPVAVAALVIAAAVLWLAMPRSAPAPAMQSAAIPAAPVPAPAVMPPAAPALAPPPAPVAAKPAVAAAPAMQGPASAPAAVPASGAKPTDRIVTVAELPADIQRDLPRLPLAGGVYSQNAAQRMLIVNGQVVGEGAELAPGLVLEQIQPKAAVMRFRGWRYSVPY